MPIIPSPRDPGCSTHAPLHGQARHLQSIKSHQNRDQFPLIADVHIQAAVAICNFPQPRKLSICRLKHSHVPWLYVRLPEGILQCKLRELISLVMTHISKPGCELTSMAYFSGNIPTKYAHKYSTVPPCIGPWRSPIDHWCFGLRQRPKGKRL